MSDAVGLTTVLPAEGQGPPLPGISETSEATQRLVDEEVRRLLDEHDANVAAGVPYAAAATSAAPSNSILPSGKQRHASGAIARS